MILSYQLSIKAQDDLREIFIYSISEFGLLQAEKYRDNLITLFEQLLKFPKEGKSRKEISKDLRSIVYVSHSMYYRVFNQTICIERILHNSRDITLVF